MGQKIDPELNDSQDAVITKQPYLGEKPPLQADSGYGSTSNTPHKPNSPASSSKDDKRGMPIPFNLPNSGNCRVFDKVVDETTAARVQDVVARIETPLVEDIQGRARKLYRKHCQMSIRLVVLGKTEKDAEPWIVIFCHEKQSRRVRRFFSKPFIKEIYAPPDRSLPSFKIHVEARAPQLKNYTAWKGVYPMNIDRLNTTLCGTLIKLDNGGPSRIATLGGVVKLMEPNGVYTLYGMTVGHVVQELDDCYCSESEPDSDDIESDLSSDEDDSLIKSAKEPSPFNRLEPPPPLSPSPISRGPNLALPESWEKLGSTFAPTLQPPSSIEIQPTRYYDWALIELDDSSMIEPNTIYGKTVKHLRSGDLKVPLQPPKYPKNPSVILMSGSTGYKRGRLSTLPSKLILAPGKAFVDTYILTLNDGNGICAGDSGSWVVNETTFEVYGHLVASDEFGDGYIVPLHATLEDMKKRHNLESVDLPSAVDILCYTPQKVFQTKSADTKLLGNQTPPTPNVDSGYYSLNTTPSKLPRNYRENAERKTPQMSSSDSRKGKKSSPIEFLPFTSHDPQLQGKRSFSEVETQLQDSDVRHKQRKRTSKTKSREGNNGDPGSAAKDDNEILKEDELIR